MANFCIYVSTSEGKRIVRGTALTVPEFMEKVQARFTPEKIRSEGVYEEMDLDETPAIHAGVTTRKIRAKKVD